MMGALGLFIMLILITAVSHKKLAQVSDKLDSVRLDGVENSAEVDTVIRHLLIQRRNDVAVRGVNAARRYDVVAYSI